MSIELAPLLTEFEVGRILRMPSRRVARLARNGIIPSITLPDGSVVFDPEDLLAWINAQKSETPTSPSSQHADSPSGLTDGVKAVPQ